jgi:putative FmdB family regulatory protein
MPLYVYKCENCGLTFERRQSIKDKPLTTCPECQGPLQPVGIVFKGPGFYVTDNPKSKSSH